MRPQSFQHPREPLSKTTSIHATMLAPNDVEIYVEPQLPAGVDPIPTTPTSTVSTNGKQQRTVILLPTPNSIPLDQYLLNATATSDNNNQRLKSIDRAILIDCPWKAVGGILERNPWLMEFPHVRLTDRETQYWRYHNHSSNHLSTIETIHHLVSTVDTQGCYDDLLW